MIRVLESNRVFQWEIWQWNWTLKSVWFKIGWKNLIPFKGQCQNLIDCNPFLIKMSIKRSKIIKIHRKQQNSSKKSMEFVVFNRFWPFSIDFFKIILFLMDFEWFDWIWIWLNWICRYDVKSDDEFGSNMITNCFEILAQVNSIA